MAVGRNDANQTKLGSCGGCEAVVSVLNQHINNPAVAEQGCRAIANLAVNDANKNKINTCGGYEAVVSALNKHSSNESVKKQGNLALSKLKS